MNSVRSVFIIFIKSIVGVFILMIYRVLFKNRRQYDNSILLVNTDQIGDIAISFNLLNSIILSHNYDNVYYLLDDKYSDLLVNTDVKIIKWNKTKYKNNLRYRFNFIKSVNSKYSFRTCINLNDQRGINCEELIIAFNSKENLTLNHHSVYISKFAIKIINRNYDYISNEYSLHKKQKDLLGRIGIEHTERCLHTFTDYKTDEYILVAPLASISIKSWDIKKYKILVDNLSERYKVILIGSSDQFKDLEDLKSNDNIINNAGKYSLFELHELVNYCKLFIGNDSGLTHLALHYNKKVVAITGLAAKDIYFTEKAHAKYLFEDFNCSDCRWFCYKRDYACLKLIKLEKVYNNCIELLNA